MPVLLASFRGPALHGHPPLSGARPAPGPRWPPSEILWASSKRASSAPRATSRTPLSCPCASRSSSLLEESDVVAAAGRAHARHHKKGVAASQSEERGLAWISQARQPSTAEGRRDFH